MSDMLDAIAGLWISGVITTDTFLDAYSAVVDGQE